MNLGELVRTFRTYADDVDDPPLFGDSEVVGYINSGYIEACRRARLIIDASTPEIVEFVVTPTDTMFDIDKRIIGIRRAYSESVKDVLCWEKTEIMDHRRPGWIDEQGEVEAYITDYDSRKILFYPKPYADTTVRLTVFREPMARLVKASDVPEIPERYHEGIVFHALHLAYMKQDAEVEDKRMSGIWAQKFDKEFGTKDYASAMEEQFLLKQPRLFNDGRW